jgi:hypothetical protein
MIEVYIDQYLIEFSGSLSSVFTTSLLMVRRLAELTTL